MRKSIYFVAPKLVEVHESEIPHPGSGQVLVETIVSAISPGTEMLVYRGQFPNMPVDSNIEALSGKFSYPMAYGYACVGRITEVGKGAAEDWLGRTVFSFQPHTSHFLATPSALLSLPPGVAPENACFFPNAETAVNLIQDAAPLIGERVLVLGQGIVGLMTTALLEKFPLECLVCADLLSIRREASKELNVSAVFDPSDPDFEVNIRKIIKSGVDLSFELTGSPLALNTAISFTTFSGRIVIGSWYGEKRALIDLGGSFHRSRIKMISSQVSTISPELTGRWDKARRYGTTWQAIQMIDPKKWITHRFSIDEASQAYRLLDTSPQETVQVVLGY
ncbi:MAG: zinc-binding dehydrogenase [Chloroflexota bacterium]